MSNPSFAVQDLAIFFSVFSSQIWQRWVEGDVGVWNFDPSECWGGKAVVPLMSGKN
jgi:hypothetical protein